MKAFTYEGELYIRAVPGKKLFNSTMVHEVVNRGDIFALRVRDQQLTIVPGKAEVVQTVLSWQTCPPCSELPKERSAQHLYAVGDRVQVFWEDTWVQNCTVSDIDGLVRGYVVVDMPGRRGVSVHVLNIKRVPL